MFKSKFIISLTVFILFLIFTSTIKNKTRIIEKKILNLNVNILHTKKNINEAQLDFFYLTSPAELEKKLSSLGFKNYQPIKFSNIFFNISDLTKIQNKISNLADINDKNIKK